MFVALIDTRRPPPEPEPEPERPDIPWRAIAGVLAWLALVAASAMVHGVAGLALVMLAVVIPILAFERSAFADPFGLKEHRQ